jgi:GT2 family glycosyltransferase
MNISVFPISVIIPTYERPDSLADTLSSFNSSEYKANEIIVVDQSANHKEANSLICKKYQNVRYFWLPTPSSTKARNLGISLAVNDIIVFSDDDVNIEGDTLTNVFNIMNQNDYALLGGLDRKTMNNKSSIFSYIIGKKSFFKRKIGHMTKSIFGRYPDKVTCETNTEWAMGYFFSVKKSYCIKWGLRFDERLREYAYAEDLDFTYRYCLNAKKENLKTVLSPEVFVNHKVSSEYRSQSEKMVKYLFVNRGYIAHKLGIRGSKAAMGWSNFWIFIYAVLKKENVNYYKKAAKELKKLQKNSFSSFN